VARTKIASAAALAGAALALVACSSAAGSHESMDGMDDEGGMHSMDHAAMAMPAKEVLPPTAPTIANPLDADRFQQAPCTTLTPDQLHELNVAAPAKPSSRGKLRDCRWQDHDGPSKMNLMVTLYPGKGLQGIYERQKNYGYLHVLPDVDGYPALNAVPEDWRGMGFCAVAVGLSDTMYLNVNVAMNMGTSQAPNQESCARAQSVAGTIMRTLKTG
jgi:hypothetical protein